MISINLKKTVMNRRERILIIEDDVDLVSAMKKMLEMRDYTVDVAYEPEEGFRAIGQSVPDLIILDVMFGSRGEAKGFDFVQQLRLKKEYSGIPVLMLTAINSKMPLFGFGPESDGEYLPVDSFLDKPVKSEELTHKVEDLLKQKTSKWQNWPEKSL